MAIIQLILTLDLVFFLPTADGDFTTVTQTLIFTIGSNSGDTLCIDVAIYDDTIVETDQTFTVEIINTPLVVVPGEQATTVTIIDDDGMLYSNAATDMYTCTCAINNFYFPTLSAHDNSYSIRSVVMHYYNVTFPLFISFRSSCYDKSNGVF